MESHFAATPFGRRRLSHAILAANVLAQRCPKEAKADKWALVRNVSEARAKLGATDRSVALLDALVSFYPDQELSGEANLVVFPSNRELARRVHGMAPATLRRHLAILVDCGLVVRRDSPNGKRYARKGQGGEIEQAFGFDLSPLLTRAEEIAGLAEEIRRERRALQALRERITITRRDISKMIAFALEEGVAGDWEAIHLQFRAIVGQLTRTATHDQLAAVASELAAMLVVVRKALENNENLQNSSGNESQFDQHKHNSKSQPFFEIEPGSEKERGGNAEPELEVKAHDQPAHKPKPPTGYPLGLVLRACPDIADYAREGIGSWNELIETANLVRAALGVSPDAWDQACEAMGMVDAAIVIAAILQRSDQISSAGGYLRALTDKARADAFSVGPVLMALLRARGRSEKAVG
ncbi:MAG: replication initiation protein RepC [Rhizobiaceae bacterium]|nr:replication initiation protein RepC [Rhizobiaceae bacterium]